MIQHNTLMLSCLNTIPFRKQLKNNIFYGRFLCVARNGNQNRNGFIARWVVFFFFPPTQASSLEKSHFHLFCDPSQIFHILKAEHLHLKTKINLLETKNNRTLDSLLVGNACLNHCSKLHRKQNCAQPLTLQLLGIKPEV